VNSFRRCVSVLGLVCLFAAPLGAQISPDHKTQHVIFVMTDGFRWQEIFSGAEASLMNKQNGKVRDPAALKKAYWRDDLQARREALMPFLWQVVAKQGQIFGNREKGSDAYVTNGMFFSYPGYNETLCGFPDDARIHSNDKVPNPNVTVLEWLNNKPAFHDQIAVFGAWDVIPYVVNPDRSHLTANGGYDLLDNIPATPELGLLNRLKAETPRVWGDEPFDAIPFYTAVEYLKAKKPSVLYLSLGETDDWAHAGQYLEYLDSAHRVDSYLKALWDLVQSMPEYQGNTTLIFSLITAAEKLRTNGKITARKFPTRNTSGWPFLDPKHNLSANVRTSPR
jgi:hypothetical protein